jgi:DNA-binding NarL/FixJ family response regulator
VETLAVLAAGATWKVAASQLGISVHTIEFHTVNLRRKTFSENTLTALVKVLS